MNERQRRFAESYAADPNATAAAISAGYSKKTAYSTGQRMLKNVEVVKYIRQLQDQAAEGRIATMRDVKLLWSDIMTNPSERTSDRLKASELYARAAGAFLHLRPGSDDCTIATGEIDGGDVVIYMPQMLDEKSCEWKGDGDCDTAE